MKISGSERIQGDGFSLRLITEDDADLIVAASLGDVPDWTYIPRKLDHVAARKWIQRGISVRENGRAVRFVIQSATACIRWQLGLRTSCQAGWL